MKLPWTPFPSSNLEYFHQLKTKQTMVPAQNHLNSKTYNN